jgi:hypothetical protein
MGFKNNVGEKANAVVLHSSYYNIKCRDEIRGRGGVQWWAK